ncbi:MAG: ATP-binding protein [Polaromonas sp.]|nr:ATP-binding protein [Polaromonas sp.]
MLEPLNPLDETARLAELLDLRLLDSPPEERFDRLTRLAIKLFGVKTALVSLIDHERQWFKSRQGLDAPETPRNISFCGHAILNDGPFVIEDASSDARFADNPLVTGGPCIRFYAGMPLRGPNGFKVGTFCLIDPVARRFDEEDRAALRDLAAVAAAEIANKDLSIALHTSSENELRLRQITDAVPALIAYVDAGQHLVFHNRAYEEVFGLTAQDIQGKTLREVMGEELYETVCRHVDKALAGEAVRYERLQPVAGQQAREYAMNYFPRYGEGAQREQAIGFYVLGTDITEMKRLNRMKSEFVSTVSHELRSPLTSIRGSLGLLAGGVAGAVPDAARNLIDIAKNNSERLIRLINDILDTEKIESGQMRLALQVVALQPLLQQGLVANEGFASEHGVTLQLHAPAEPLWVNIDNDRITQVLTNLVSNAVKFSPRSAAVEVTLSRRDAWVRIEVLDHGPGIPDEFRSRIFQKFSQADASDTRVKGGTGLGLAISKAIVERLGGNIGFTSTVGVGSCFFFELPEWQAAPVPAAIGLPASAQRILVCEPDPDIARLISMMLEKAGFEVDAVHGCQEVLDHLAVRSYAAMTVDLQPTDHAGVALILALRSDARTRNLPIVVVSAAAGESQIRFNNQQLSVSNWLNKPIDENLLVCGLRSSIASMAAGLPRILHVEDDLDIQTITAALAQDFAVFEFAATLPQARAQLLAQRFDLVLLDLSLPGGSGWDLFPDINALPHRPPVVVFSATDVTDGDDRGAAAILVKAQTSNEELLSTIQRVLQITPATDSKDS